jgi:hypothetical protein
MTQGCGRVRAQGVGKIVLRRVVLLELGVISSYMVVGGTTFGGR